MVSLVLKAHNNKLRFNIWPNCCFTLSQKYPLNQSVWNFLVCTNEVVCHVDPLHSAIPCREEKQCAW